MAMCVAVDSRMLLTESPSLEMLHDDVMNYPHMGGMVVINTVTQTVRIVADDMLSIYSDGTRYIVLPMVSARGCVNALDVARKIERMTTAVLAAY